MCPVESPRHNLLIVDPVQQKLVPNQGQRTLNRFAARDLHQEAIIPSADSAFHGEAVRAGMLFQQRQSEASEPG